MLSSWQRHHGIACWAAWLVAGSAGSAVVIAAQAPHARASESREFSSEEEAQLRDGKLVVRPEQRSFGHSRLIGGMSWQVVDAPPDEVWRTLSDVRTYPHFLPAVEEARLVDANGPFESLYVRHHLGIIVASYWVRARYDQARGLVEFHLDHAHPSSIRDAWGELRVTPYTGHRSVVSLAIMADLGNGLLIGLVRANVHTWMLRVPQQLKRYVEALHH